MATRHREHTTSANLVQTSIERAEESIMTLPNEEQPLLQSDPVESWKPPPAFLWIELGSYTFRMLMGWS